MQRKLCISLRALFPRTLCKAMLASMADDSARAGRPANRSVNRLRDPRALRALAHPIRLSLVGLLRVEGPLTATRAAELLGESSASTSFHLRQLAKYGLVEEAGGGKGRERPWRATAMFTNLPDVAENPDLAVAAELLSSVIAERYFEDVMRWLEVRQAEPEEWQRVAQFGDTYLYLTADELAALGEQTQQMMDQYIDRQTQPGTPAGGRPPGQLPAPGLPAVAAVRPPAGAARRARRPRRETPPGRRPRRPRRPRRTGATGEYRRRPRTPDVQDPPAAARDRLPAVLGRAEHLPVRRPDLVHRAAAGRGARAARQPGRDGLPQRPHLAAQPAVRPARRGLGGPARPPPGHHDRGGPGPGRAAGQHPGLLGAGRAQPGPGVRGGVRGRDAEHLLHRVRRRAVRGPGAQRPVRGRQLADLPEPGAGRGGRPQRGRPAGAGPVRAVRAGRRRAVVPRLGVLPEPDPPGRARPGPGRRRGR